MTKFFRLGFLWMILLLGTGSLLAEEPTSEPTQAVRPIDKPLPPINPYISELPKDNDRFMSEFAYMLFVLGAVVAVMILISWFFKRMMQTKVLQLNQSSLIKVTETRSLGHKSLLHLIEVYGMTILVSETPTGVQALAKFKTDNAFDKLMTPEGE